MRGYPQCSFWISITLVKIYIPCIIINQGKNTIELVGTVLNFMHYHHIYWSTFFNGRYGYCWFVCCLKEYWACFYACRSKDGKERTTVKQNAVKWVLFVARWLHETTIIIIGVAKICRQNKSIWHFFLVLWTENFKHFCFYQYCLIWIGGEGLCVRGGDWYGRVVVTGVGPGCHADDSSWKCLDYLCWEQLSCNFQALMKQDIKPLMWYPVVYLATTIFPLIHRFVWKRKRRKP